MSILQRRAEILAELIQRTSGLAPDHPRLAAISRACKEQVDFHSFLDTVPNTVDQELSLLRERLENHAQFDKSKALGLLADQLANVDVGSSQQLDFQHRILSFLLASAHRVLDTEVDPSILAPPEKGDGTIDEIPVWSDDSGSDAEWWAAELPYSPGDALSQWSGDEEEQQERDVFNGETPLVEGEHGSKNGEPGLQNDVFMSPRQLFGGGGGRGPDPADAPLTPVAPARTAHRSPRRTGRRIQGRTASPWRRQQGRLYGPTSLAVWLAAKESGGHPARHLDPRRCFTQQELILQVLNVFKGLNTPGLAFKYDTGTQTYSPRRGIHTECMPPSTCATLLQRFAELGTWLRNLQNFCDVILGGGGATSLGLGASSFFLSEEERENMRSLPTIAALASAVSCQVLAIRGQLVVIETLACAVPAPAPAPTPAEGPSSSILDAEYSSPKKKKGSLLTLRVQSATLQRQVVALHNVVEQCRWQGDAASTASRVLNTIHAAFDAHALDASSQGGVVAAMFAEIFAATYAPYLDALGVWVSSGSLENAPPEFFIRPASGNLGCFGDYCNGFWTDAIDVARLADGSVAAPKMLQRHIDNVVAAGVAVRGLKEQGIDLTAGDDNGMPSLSEALSVVFYKAVGDVISQRQKLANSTVDVDEPLTPKTPTKNANECTSVDDTGEKGGVWTREWVAATARAGAGSSGGILLPHVEDLPDLPFLVSTALDLPAASTIEALWQNSSRDRADASITQEERRKNASTASHPIADAMQSASIARVEHFHAGRVDTVISDFFTSFGSVGGLQDGHYWHADGNQQQQEKQQQQLAVHDELLDGRWSEWYSKVTADLDGRNTYPLGGVTTTAADRLLSKNLKSPWYKKNSENAFPHKPAVWAAAPPLHSLLEQCLLAPLQARASQAGADACAAVLRAGLSSQLAAIRHVAALALPSLEPFVRVLLLSASTSWGVDGLSSTELGASLQNALKDAGMAAQGVASGTIDIANTNNTGADDNASKCNTNTNSQQSACSVSAFSRLNISLKPALPLALVANGKFLESHSAITRLFLQLQWAEHSLRAARQSSWKISSAHHRDGGQRAKAKQAKHVLQHEMLHVVTAVHQHIATRFDAAGAALRLRVATCTSLTEIRERCGEFVDTVGQGCLIAPSGLAKELRELVVALMDCCLHHCILLRQEHVFSAAAAAESAAASAASVGDEDFPDNASSIKNDEELGASGAPDTSSEAEERLRQVRSALLATQRAWEKRRDAFMKVLVRQGGEVGAHSEVAAGLLAVVDPSSWYERRNAR